MFMDKFAAICLVLGCAAMPVHAQIYRCQQPNGAATYQDAPCEKGVQKKVENSNSLATSDSFGAEMAAHKRSLERQLVELEKERKDGARRRAEESRRFEAELPQMRAEATKRAADALANFKKDETQKIAELRKCAHRDKSADCSANGYRRILRGMHRSDVEDILGAAKTQLLGTQELLYFTVPVLEGATWQTSRIQLKLGYDSSFPVGVRGITNRVTALDIY